MLVIDMINDGKFWFPERLSKTKNKKPQTTATNQEFSLKFSEIFYEDLWHITDLHMAF